MNGILFIDKKETASGISVGKISSAMSRNITIKGCESITLEPKSINIKVDIHIENFEDIDTIIINDYIFKKEVTK